jgi:hypothetical protein
LRQSPVGVGAGDGVVGGVVVAGEGLRAGGVEDRVDGQEPAGGRVVLAGADDVQAGGGVGGFAEERVGVGPGGGSLTAGGVP